MRARIRVPLDALAYMTLVTPEIVFGIAALIFFVEAGALVGVDSPLGIWTILAAHVVFNASVVALIVRARFVGMGQSFEEASFDLGAGPLATFRQVTLPRLAPAILAGGLLAFTFSFDDFYTSFFVSGVGFGDVADLHLLPAPLRRLTGGQRHGGDDPRAHARRDRRRLSRAAADGSGARAGAGHLSSAGGASARRPGHGIVYLTFTQPYIFANTKCGVMLHRTRYRPGSSNVSGSGVHGPWGPWGERQRA